MPASCNILIHVDAEFWEQIRAGTSAWSKRSDSDICRFALRELYTDRGLPIEMLLCTSGDRAVHVKSFSPEEIQMWETLAGAFGSKGSALRVALLGLHACLYAEEEKEPWLLTQT